MHVILSKIDALLALTHSLPSVDPALLVALAENLMEIVGAMHPEAASGLGSSGSGEGALAKALEAISALARDMTTGITPGKVYYTLDVLECILSCGIGW